MRISNDDISLAELPIPLCTTGARRFVVRWNNSKSKSASPGKHAWHEAEGVRFSNGRVALDYAISYAYLGELEETLRHEGEYRIEWVDA